MTKSAAFLKLEGLSAGYGDLTILKDIHLTVEKGETVCVIGRNGMGKTTLLSTIMGLARQHCGEISFDGKDLSGLSTLGRARLGLGLVPQEREVFKGLTVQENLLVAKCDSRHPIEEAYDLFPRLKERRNHLARNLSGGEQQMLSIARALMTSPDLLLLDEPSEGLAPVIVHEVFAGLDHIRAQGSLTILIVEQHVRSALAFGERCIALKNGRIVHDGPSAELLANQNEIDRLVGFSTA